MTSKNKIVTINAHWCKGCGICVAFCPKKVLIMKHDKAVIANPNDCIKCGNCELRCPDYAIYLKEVEA